MKTGCPVVFIYRFIIYAELLAIKIRANNINAINNLKKNLTACWWYFTYSWWLWKIANANVRYLKCFSDISRLHMNYDKTNIVWIGSKRFSTAILLPAYQLKLSTCIIRLSFLGIHVHFDAELDKMIQLNYDP